MSRQSKSFYDGLCLDNVETAIEIAALPLEIRGYGPVKSAAAKVAERKEETPLEKIQYIRKIATIGSGVIFVDGLVLFRPNFLLEEKILKCESSCSNACFVYIKMGH